MKWQYKIIIMTLLFGVIFSNLQAQSELIVEWADANGDVKMNALYNAIIADTLANGSRVEDRVYVLRAGGYYWNQERIDNNGWHLRITGEAADPNDETKNPPVLQMAAREDATTSGGIIRGQGDITLKNVWLTGALTGTGVQTSYQPFQIDASNGTFLFDNCIFDRSNFAMIAFTNGGNDITITNCTFRNLIGRPSTQQWEGRGISIWADQKSVVIENNTFFNIGMTAIQIENGAADYVRIIHNTFVNVGRIITQVTWWREAYIANNLIVNGYWHAEGRNDYMSSSRDPRLVNDGYFRVSPLPSSYGPEAGRRILFSNIAAYTAPEFTSYYADSLRVPTIMQSISSTDYVDVYENIVVKDTMWMNPGMPSMTSENYPNMIQNIQDLRAGVTPATEWFWNLPVFDGEECFECVSWPIAENFAYTNTTLHTASTNGLPLGDLNWFPTQKADWVANHAAYIETIEAMAGPVVVYDLVDEVQAEDGTVANGAEVVAFGGEAWYTLTGGSNIEWKFNSTYTGLIDMKLKARADGNNIGWDFILNGNNIVDAARGWGQFVFWTGSEDPQTFWSGKSTTEFYETGYLNAETTPSDKFAVVAGENTLKLKNSWNPVSFAYVDLYEAGTENLIASLIPSAAVNNGAAPGGEGAWIPIGFKSVALKGGTATASFTVENAGNYVVQLFYQNFSGESTGDVLVNGTSAASFSFSSEDDSTGSSGLSDVFPLTAGTHTIGITGNNVNLDFIQLIKKSVLVSVDDKNIPDGYALSQNYPNPFNPTTKIDFSVGKASNVKLTIFNVLGQKVATVLNKQLSAGSYSVDFNASALSSGVYFYGIEAGDFKIHKKMILLK